MLQEMKQELNDQFLKLFIEHLKSIFPYKIDKDFMNYNTGTMGWSEAFRRACGELKKDSLNDCYESLDWESHDAFCHELGRMIIEKELVK